MQGRSNVHPSKSASGLWPGTATTRPDPSSRTPSTTFIPIEASTGEQRYRSSSIPRMTSNVETQPLATGQGGARCLSQQPTEPFYNAPHNRDTPWSSSPSIGEYSLPGTFPGMQGYSGFAPSVANPWDSTLVERGSPPSTTFSYMNDGKHQLGDDDKVLPAAGGPTRNLKTAPVDDNVIHRRKNDKGSHGYVPDYDRYRSHRSSEPPDLSSTHPLGGPPYPSQLDEVDLWAPRSTHANGSEPRNIRRQQSPVTLTFTTASREGDVLVDNGFLLLSPADAEEEWVKVRRPKGDF